MADCDAAIAALEDYEWTEEHEKECSFAYGKTAKRKAEASYEDLLLLDEDREQVQWSGQSVLIKIRDAEAQRVKKHIRKGLGVGGGQFPSAEKLRGHRCFVKHDDDWRVLVARGSCRFMIRAVSPLMATVIVVADLINIPSLLKWSAVLSGGILTTVVGARSGGACLKYRRAICPPPLPLDPCDRCIQSQAHRHLAACGGGCQAP